MKNDCLRIWIGLLWHAKTFQEFDYLWLLAVQILDESNFKCFYVLVSSLYSTKLESEVKNEK